MRLQAESSDQRREDTLEERDGVARRGEERHDGDKASRYKADAARKARSKGSHGSGV